MSVTSAVPSIRLRGTSRVGFFTSPAVNVMSNHASLANSEPTIATPTAAASFSPVSALDRDDGPPFHVGPGGVPEPLEVGRYGPAVGPDGQPEDDERKEGDDLGAAEYVLHDFAAVYAADVDRGQEQYARDRGDLRRVHAQAGDGEDDGVSAQGRHEHGEELAERHGHGGDGAGLDHRKQGPPVQERDERVEGFAQVHVLAARMGDNPGQLAVGEGPR